MILSQDNPLAAFPFYRPKTIAGSDHHHYVQWQQQNDPEHLSESGFYRTIPYRNPGQFLCCQDCPGRRQYGNWFCSLIYKSRILQKCSTKKDCSCLYSSQVLCFMQFLQLRPGRSRLFQAVSGMLAKINRRKHKKALRHTQCFFNN